MRNVGVLFSAIVHIFDLISHVNLNLALFRSSFYSAYDFIAPNLKHHYIPVDISPPLSLPILPTIPSPKPLSEADKLVRLQEYENPPSPCRMSSFPHQSELLPFTKRKESWKCLF